MQNSRIKKLNWNNKNNKMSTGILSAPTKLVDVLDFYGEILSTHIKLLDVHDYG